MDICAYIHIRLVKTIEKMRDNNGTKKIKHNKVSGKSNTIK